MKTFSKYIENQNIEGKIVQIATILSESNLEPNIFLKTWFDKNDPDLSLVLTEAGMWDGIKQGIGAVGAGLKQGFQNFKNNAFGPETHYTNAVTSLNKLLNFIEADPNLKQNYSRFTNNISGILNDLKANQGDVPMSNNGQWTSRNQNSFNNVNPQQPVQPQPNVQQQSQPQQPAPVQQQSNSMYDVNARAKAKRAGQNQPQFQSQSQQVNQQLPQSHQQQNQLPPGLQPVSGLTSGSHPDNYAWNPNSNTYMFKKWNPKTKSYSWERTNRIMGNNHNNNKVQSDIEWLRNQ
jgi:hypothetical protein